MTTLYVFVDESGNHSRDRCYAVAGCWCVSRRRSPHEVLGPTKDRLLTLVYDAHGLGNQPGELKGNSIPPRVLGDLLPSIERFAYEDSTLVTGPLPWRTSIPVGFTVTVLNAAVFRQSMAGYDGRLTALELLQVTALSSVLLPITNSSSLLDVEQVDAVRVLPDGSTWDTATSHVSRQLDAPGLEFETRDSTTTPGIQIADLVAYASRRHTLEGDCGDAVAVLDALRVTR